MAAGNGKSGSNRRDRELRLLLSLEMSMQMLLQQHASKKQPYDFLREPLSLIRTERHMIELAAAGDPVAQMARRTRRGPA